MSDEEGPRPREQGGRIDTEFIRAPSGYLMIVNMFLAFLSMCMMSGWLGDVGAPAGRYNFFMYACVHTWVALLVIFILRLVKVPTHCSIISWDLTYALNTIIFVILLTIGSTFVAIHASDFNKYYTVAGVEYSTCSKYSCILLIITACFGFITMIGCMIECFFHVKDWRET